MTTSKKNTTTTTGDMDAFLATLHAALGAYLGVDGTVTVVATAEPEAEVEEAAPAKAKAKAKKGAAAKKDEAPAKDEKGRRKQLSKMDDDALRALVIGYDYEEDEVADADTSDLVDAIISEEFPDADEADEAEDEDEDEADDDEDEDDEDDEDEDEETLTREDLEGLNLRELKAKAKEAGYATADLKGLDQDGIIDLLVGDAESEDEDEAEEEEESEWYTEAQLKAMTIAELRALADEYEVDHEGVKKPALVKALLED